MFCGMFLLYTFAGHLHCNFKFLIKVFVLKHAYYLIVSVTVLVSYSVSYSICFLSYYLQNTVFNAKPSKPDYRDVPCAVFR